MWSIPQAPLDDKRKSLDSEPRAAASLGHWWLEATERMPVCTLVKALTRGKATSKFNVQDKDEIRVGDLLVITPR